MENERHTDPVDIPQSPKARKHSIEDGSGYRPYDMTNDGHSVEFNSTMFPHAHRPRRSTFSAFNHPLSSSVRDSDCAGAINAPWSSTIAALRKPPDSKAVGDARDVRSAVPNPSSVTAISPLFRTLSLSSPQGLGLGRSNTLTYQYPFPLSTASRSADARKDSLSSQPDSYRDSINSPSTSFGGDSLPVTPIDTFSPPPQGQNAKTTSGLGFGQSFLGLSGEGKGSGYPTQREQRPQRTRSVTLANTSRLETIHARAPLQTEAPIKSVPSTEEGTEVSRPTRTSPSSAERQAKHKQPPVTVNSNGDVFPSFLQTGPGRKSPKAMGAFKSPDMNSSDVKEAASVQNSFDGTNLVKKGTGLTQAANVSVPNETKSRRRFSFTGFSSAGTERPALNRAASIKRTSSPTGERMLQGQFLD